VCECLFVLVIYYVVSAKKKHQGPINALCVSKQHMQCFVVYVLMGRKRVLEVELFVPIVQKSSLKVCLKNFEI
jgi:hypothetical protein